MSAVSRFGVWQLNWLTCHHSKELPLIQRGSPSAHAILPFCVALPFNHGGPLSARPLVATSSPAAIPLPSTTRFASLPSLTPVFLSFAPPALRCSIEPAFISSLPVRLQALLLLPFPPPLCFASPAHHPSFSPFPSSSLRGVGQESSPSLPVVSFWLTIQLHRHWLSTPDPLHKSR